MTSFSHRPSSRTARPHTIIGAGIVLAVGLSVSGCTVKKQDAPPLTGPSELGTSISVQATPDVINQDGASQSSITITARDANGQPLRNVPLRVEILVDGVVVDFGRLSARNVVTDSSGRAFVTYTAPAPPPEPVDTFTIVTLHVTPSGTDFGSNIPRTVNIRLVPPGVILPPNGTPLPAFTFSQPAQENTPVQFDASTSRDDGQIVTYDWDFGDSTTGTGVRPAHTYSLGGTYSVTLTVTDDRNLRASATQQVLVGAVANPTASFTASPTTPAVNEEVFFNAGGSTAAPGRRIVSFDWTFGDGESGSGELQQHDYAAIGSYTVTLKVEDDAGKTDSTSTLIAVGAGQQPTANIVFSPANPSPGQTVNFNGTTSTAPAGRTIVKYEWNFGDGAKATGATVSHKFSPAGLYVVTLTVTDSAEEQGTTTASVDVGSTSDPDADFSISPNPAAPAQQVQFDAAGSTAAGGATIVSYQWNFGDPNGTLDPNTGSGKTVTHRYEFPGTYTVTLTVRDSNGRTDTTTQTVDIEIPGP